MRTRTRLTTPVGSEPDAPGTRADVEVYSPGLTLPRERHVPGRMRRVWAAIAVVVVVGGGAFFMWRVSTHGQEFDPSLDVPLNTEDGGIDR